LGNGSLFYKHHIMVTRKCKYSNILLLLLLTCIVSQTRSCPDFIPMLPYISLNGYTSSSGSEIHP
jgi:hypothetical protein